METVDQLIQHAEHAHTDDRPAEAAAAMLQARARAELAGLDAVGPIWQRWRALRQPADVYWPAPTATEQAIDAEYVSLAARTLTSRWNTPANLATEKARFLAAAAPSDPRFVYAEPPDYPVEAWLALLDQLDLANPLHRLYNELGASFLEAIAVVRRHDSRLIQDRAIAAHGTPDATLIADARQLLDGLADVPTPDLAFSAQEAWAPLDAALKSLNLDGWTVIIEERMNARMSVSSIEKKVRIRHDARFSAAQIRGLEAHEIGVHVARAAAGDRQPLRIFALGLAGYPATEEGYAIRRELRADGDASSTFRRIASRILAADWSFSMGFAELYAHCADIEPDIDACFALALRTKRSFADVSQHGTDTKDTIYLAGLRRVEQALDANPDLERYMMVGKISLDHLPAIERAVEEGWLKLP